MDAEEKRALALRLLAEEDEARLRAVIRAHHAAMDDAEFFEILKGESGAPDDAGRFLRITRLHLELSGTPYADHLERVIALLTAAEEGRLEGYLEGHAGEIDAGLTDTLLHSAEQAIAAKGQIEIGRRMLAVARRVIDRFGHSGLNPYYHLVECGYHLTVERPEQALAAIEAARPGCAGGNDLLCQALAVNEAIALFRLGRYQEAIDHTVRLIPALDDDHLRRSALSNLAMVRSEVGEFNAARRLLHELAEECAAAEEYSHLAKVYGNLANLYGRLGLREEEGRHLLLSLEAARRKPAGNKGYDGTALVTGYGNLCLHALCTGDLPQAEQWFERFKTAAEENGIEPYRLTYAALLAQLHQHRGDRQRALNVVRNVTRATVGREDYEYLAFLGLAGMIALRAGLVEEAMGHFRAAVELAERTGHRELLPSGYGYLGLCHLQRGERERALALIENAFAGEGELRRQVGDRGIQFSFSATREELNRDLLAAAHSRGDTPLLFELLPQVKAQAIAFNRRGGAAGRKPLAHLPAGTLLLDFYHQGEVSFCMAASPHLPAPVKVELPADEGRIERWARRFAATLPTARYLLARDPFGWLVEAWQGLLAPLADYLDGHHSVIVSPSSWGNHLPFHLFPDPAGVRLIEKVAVSYLPTAALLAEGSGAGGQPPLVMACSRDGDGPAGRAGFHREAREVAALLAVEPLIDPADSWERLAAAEEAEVVHLACHGEFDDGAPLQSGLYLRRAGAEAFLPVDELIRREPAVELMFLSGCDTGRVGLLRSQEVVGLLSSLLGGGVRSTVLSFWPILAEEGTAHRVAVDFYRYWRQEGLSKTESLRQAMLRHAGSPNPYLWGGYALFGDGR